MTKVILLLEQNAIPTRLRVEHAECEESEKEKDARSTTLYKTRSHKAIHYERQTQLKFKHTFLIDSLCDEIPRWCKRAPDPRPGDAFTLRLNFTLPERRKLKRHSLVLDVVSTKEYEAAQMGLMYARSLFDLFAAELYKSGGCVLTRGLQVGPSWVSKGKVKTCVVFSLPASNRVEDMAAADALVFAVKAIFSAEDLNYMEEAKGLLYFNGELLGSQSIRCDEDPHGFLDTAKKVYSNENVKKILYSQIENRNVLYAFENSGSIRQGMMVKTGRVWRPVEVKTVEDIYRVVEDFGVLEFIPAVNGVNKDYPTMITIETDPGDMFMTVLGKKKCWTFSTYIAEKILKVLDRYKILYHVKFSGNKGWHIQIPIELREPFDSYQVMVEALVNKELGNLPDEEKVVAMLANFVQLEDVKSYKDPFFVARRFVDLVGAHIMFFELYDINTVLSMSDLQQLCLRVGSFSSHGKGDDFYRARMGFSRVELPQVLSINPYSKFRRQFKLLIDHSSNKREGKMRSVFSLHSKSGLMSVPALLCREEGVTKFDERMRDYEFVCAYAHPDSVLKQLEGSEGYIMRELAEKWDFNDAAGFEKFLHDHKGLLLYLLQNGGEALELLDSPTALWVNANLWKKVVSY